MMKRSSPCLRCSRVADPATCEDKSCQLWRQWFIERWDALRHQPKEAMEMVQTEPVGVCIGGRRYAAPHETERYLYQDPCESCLCPRELCGTPCRIRRDWDRSRKEVLL